MVLKDFRRRRGDFTALESKRRRNAIIQDVPALSRFTAADVKAKFTIPELTNTKLPSRSADELTPQQEMRTPAQEIESARRAIFV